MSPGPGHGNPVRRRAIIFLSWRLAAAAAAAAGGGARVRACVHARSNARKTPPRPGQRQKPVPLVPTAGAAPPRVKRQEWAWIPVTPSPAAHLRTHAAACMTGRAATATRPVTGAAPKACADRRRARVLPRDRSRRRTPHVQFSDPIVMDPSCCMQCPAAAALRRGSGRMCARGSIDASTKDVVTHPIRCQASYPASPVSCRCAGATGMMMR